MKKEKEKNSENLWVFFFLSVKQIRSGSCLKSVWLSDTDLSGTEAYVQKIKWDLTHLSCGETLHKKLVSASKLQLLTCDMPSMSSWMRSVWLYCRMARPTRKMISKPCRRTPRIITNVKTSETAQSTRFFWWVRFILRNRNFLYLIHENIKDACGYGQREEGEEQGEEPRRGVHRRVETLRSEMDVQFWKLLLGCKELTDFQKRKREQWCHASEWMICCLPVDETLTAGLICTVRGFSLTCNRYSNW